MKKRNPANPSRPSRTRPESSAPAYHPTTGQVLSEVEGNNPYLAKQPRQKAKLKKGKPTFTIAPGLRSTRDVLINLPK